MSGVWTESDLSRQVSEWSRRARAQRPVSRASTAATAEKMTVRIKACAEPTKLCAPQLANATHPRIRAPYRLMVSHTPSHPTEGVLRKTHANGERCGACEFGLVSRAPRGPRNHCPPQLRGAVRNGRRTG